MVRYLIGFDVGSTTVKAVVVEAATDTVVWQDYQRHETRQPEKVLEFLERMEAAPGISPGNARIFFTGSGAGLVARMTGGKFVQEVHAVSLAVEKLHPEVYSVIELGGQDAKIIIFQDDPASGRRKKIASMNDKCAGGTGAVLDKINAKLRIPVDEMSNLPYRGVKLHPVAGKCGVFAETDINGLQKAGTPPIELMASLFDAIVLQNLSVLTRGNTLLPHVLLLGGPNTFLKGMQEAWQANIPKMWADRQVPVPIGVPIEELIRTPENAQFYAALGLIEYAQSEDDAVGLYCGRQELMAYLNGGREEEKAQSGAKGLTSSRGEMEAFLAEYTPKKFIPYKFCAGERVQVLMGIDAGSTSTKAVLIRPDGELLLKAYQLSGGNPIEDTIEVVGRLRGIAHEQGAELDVVGVGTTGYAKDMLKEVLHADVALVETVAHTMSAMQHYDDPHVIVDVGGQDIKLIFLHKGRVTDFKLNTQCSAGNGYFLQATAEGFGIPTESYAERAFAAKTMPEFGYGCAVFLQGDIVNFQRQGWRAEEILAGLAAVLPKNIFLYVAAVPNLPLHGSRFVLQGGTQKNLAVVKAEVDFLRGCFHRSGIEPEIVVHEHCGESGAIGAALEAGRIFQRGHRTSFIGLHAIPKIHFQTTRNEETRCNYCRNNCLRTFLDVSTNEPSMPTARVTAPPVLSAQPSPLVDIQAAPGARTVVEMPKPSQALRVRSKVALAEGARRLILATCEKGTVEDIDAMRAIKHDLDVVKAANPDLMEFASRRAFHPVDVEIVADEAPPRAGIFDRAATRMRIAAAQARGSFRIGIPRVLNAYTYAPLFQGYFQSLGIRPENIVYSGETSAELYRAGSSRGAVDPCFPSKVALAHVHDLLQTQHSRKAIDAIWFPMFATLTTHLTDLTGSCACPTVTATPEAAKAAFTKERDLFAENDIRYVDPILHLHDVEVLTGQMFRAWAGMLGLSEAENRRAVGVGFQALARFEADIQRKARSVLDQLEREARMGIVMLGRPYHHDPGLNHGILEEFQKLGYPIFSQSTLPLDEDVLDRLFGDEVRAGSIAGPLDISDVWKNRYSASTNHKIWAAKFAARHPNLAAIELSSFKCGHDAPIYNVIERILETSGTPFFAFKDLDENKPSGSLRIRVETVDHFLRLHREREFSQPMAELARA